MAKTAFGLDIGATTIKAVWLNHEKNGYILQACYTAQTPPKGMISESPVDQEEMSQALRKVVSEAKITTPYVNVALPENQVYTRVIEMPVLSDKELSSAIIWEAEQYIPVPLESISFDYKVLARPTQAQSTEKMHVLLVGAPKVLINKYDQILSMAGLGIASLETEILSTLRALVFGENFPPSLIVTIGAISTSLAIVRSGIITFTYSIPLGGVAISRAIAADFGFTVTQAEEYKKTYGMGKQTLGGKIGKSSEPILMSILAEIKKAIAFDNEKYKENDPLRQILLSGGTAKLPGIELFFAQNCGVETVIANPWKVLASQNVPKEILESATDYTVAVGLAMKDYV